jgi:hypothetical protein
MSSQNDANFTCQLAAALLVRLSSQFCLSPFFDGRLRRFSTPRYFRSIDCFCACVLNAKIFCLYTLRRYPTYANLLFQSFRLLSAFFAYT